MKKNKLIHIGITSFLVLGLSISLQSLIASWQAPSQNPPNANISDLIFSKSTTNQKIEDIAGTGGGLSVTGKFGVAQDSSFLGKVGIGTVNPQEKLEVAGKIRATTPLDSDNPKTVATKEYVDAQSGGTVVINGSIMPTMVSDLSPSSHIWGGAASYCANLSFNGYTDWRMPSRDELVYITTGGIGNGIQDGVALWTVTGGSGSSNWLVLYPADGNWYWYSYSNDNYVRCVR